VTFDQYAASIDGKEYVLLHPKKDKVIFMQPDVKNTRGTEQIVIMVSIVTQVKDLSLIHI